MKKLIVLILGVLIITSCSNRKEVSEIQKRGDLYYELGTDDLYSGLIYSTYNEDLNQFEKEINDGKLHGEVKFWYPDGQLKNTIEYEDSKLQGNAKFWYPNGQLKYSLEYEMDKLNGAENYWYSNGQIKHKFLYKKGMLDGPDTTWYKNGKVNFWGSYALGKQNGNWMYFSDNSDTIIEINYKDGLLNGFRKEYYPNGKLRLSFHYSDEKLNGPVSYFSSNGDLVFNGNYLEDKKNGIWMEYYNNDKIKLNANFNNDLKDTTWTYYGENDRIVFNLNFKNDYPNGEGYILTDIDTLNLFFGFDERLNCNSLYIRGVDFVRGMNFGLRSYKESKDRTVLDFFSGTGEGIILQDLVFFDVPGTGWGEGIDLCTYDNKKKELWGPKEAFNDSYFLVSTEGERYNNINSNKGEPTFTYFLSSVYYPEGSNNGGMDLRNYKKNRFDIKGMLTKIGQRKWTQDGLLKIAIDSLYFKNGDKAYFFTQKDPLFVVKWVKSNSTGYINYIDHIDFLYKNNIGELISINPISISSYSFNEINSVVENIDEKEDNYDISSEESDFDLSTDNISDCDEFLKEYEKFMLHYIDVIKKYKKNPDNVTFMKDYFELLAEYSNWNSKSEGCADDPKIASKIAKIQVKLFEAMEDF